MQLQEANHRRQRMAAAREACLKDLERRNPLIREMTAPRVAVILENMHVRAVWANDGRNCPCS